MYEFWYNYIKPKYGSKVNLCYMRPRPVPIGESKKVIGLMKEELNGKIMTVSRA